MTNSSTNTSEMHQKATNRPDSPSALSAFRSPDGTSSRSPIEEKNQLSSTSHRPSGSVISVAVRRGFSEDYGEGSGVVNDESEMLLQAAAEEVDRYYLENAALKVRLNRMESALAKVKAVARSFRDERDRLRKKLRDVQSQSHKLSLANSPLNDVSLSSTNDAAGLCQPIQVVRPKVAINKRLRAVIAEPPLSTSNNSAKSGPVWISGAQISTIGVDSPSVADHLIQKVLRDSEICENTATAISSADCLRMMELELERSQSREDQLSAEATFLHATLAEARACNDHLAGVCGQLESNYTALKQVAILSDKTDTIALLLLEWLGGVARDTLDPHAEPIRQFLTAANRDDLLSCDDDTSNVDSYSSDDGFKSGGGRGDFTNSESAPRAPANNNKSVLDTVREKLLMWVESKRRLAATTLSVGDAFALWADFAASSTTSRTAAVSDRARIQLEHAVLLQELTALKEERADLRAQLYLMEQDKNAAQLTVREKTAQLQQARIANQMVTEKFNELQALDKGAKATNGSSAADNKSREEQLKERLADLLDATSAASEASTMRQTQTESFLLDLRNANQALLRALDRQKRKQREKILRLDEQIDALRLVRRRDVCNAN
uniref:Uncharacterized protein n=1 Tax=Plectus sambesii TaxID=2011161 RepID=A0A914XF96_9BILA